METTTKKKRKPGEYGRRFIFRAHDDEVARMEQAAKIIAEGNLSSLVRRAITDYLDRHGLASDLRAAND